MKKIQRIRRRSPIRSSRNLGKVYSLTDRLERKKFENIQERLRRFMLEEQEFMPESIDQFLHDSKNHVFLQQCIKIETVLNQAINQIITNPALARKIRLREELQRLLRMHQTNAKEYPKWFRLFMADSLDQTVQYIRTRAILPAVEDALTDTAHALRVIEVLPSRKT